MLMFVGTYTRKTESEGVYAFEVDDGVEQIRALTVNPGIDNPSWIVANSSRHCLFAVNEIRDYQGGNTGAVNSFTYDDQGRLTFVSRQSSMGADPCHLAQGPEGAYLLVSNYSGGNLASFPVDDSGAIGVFNSFVQHAGHSVDPMRQKGPHVHSVTLDQRGEMAYVADLGTDQVVSYPVDRHGQVQTNARKSIRVKPGAGPRHFCFDADDRYGYLINELDNTIVSFERDEGGTLTELETVSALPDDFTDPSYCADIHLSPDGHFLYASNRGHDSIAVYRLEADGVMKLIQHQSTGGAHPRHFSLSPDGSRLFAANRDSDNIVVLARDSETGLLTETGTKIDVPAPSCVLFVQ